MCGTRTNRKSPLYARKKTDIAKPNKPKAAPKSKPKLRKRGVASIGKRKQLPKNEDPDIKIVEDVDRCPPKNNRDYYVYILHTLDKNNKPIFYTGFTGDLSTRLLQHNGHIKGGARYTSCYTGWEYLCYVSGMTGPAGKSAALSLERLLKKNVYISKSKLAMSVPDDKYLKRVLLVNCHLSPHQGKRRLTINWGQRRCASFAEKLEWNANVVHRVM